MSDARKFQVQLGEEVADGFGGEFRFYRSRLELRRAGEGGDDVITLAGATKWSPKLSLAFHFGRSFEPVRAIEKLCGFESMPWHIFQYSVNARAMKGLRYPGQHTWQVDLRLPTSGLAADVKRAIEGVACPFFARFRDLKTARDAVADDDRWCLGGKMSWRSLLLMDAALDDRAHFERWMGCLDPLGASQAAKMLADYAEARSRT